MYLELKSFGQDTFLQIFVKVFLSIYGGRSATASMGINIENTNNSNFFITAL